MIWFTVYLSFSFPYQNPFHNLEPNSPFQLVPFHREKESMYTYNCSYKALPYRYVPFSAYIFI